MKWKILITILGFLIIFSLVLLFTDIGFSITGGIIKENLTIIELPPTKLSAVIIP